WEAYNRIEVARAARRFPVILDLLAEGSVNLTAVRLLAPPDSEQLPRATGLRPGREKARDRRDGRHALAPARRAGLRSAPADIAPRVSTPRGAGARFSLACARG